MSAARHTHDFVACFPPVCVNLNSLLLCISWSPNPASRSRRLGLPLQQKTSVHQLGLDLWRDVVVRNRRIRERLLGMLLDMVQVGFGGAMEVGL